MKVIRIENQKTKKGIFRHWDSKYDYPINHMSRSLRRAYNKPTPFGDTGIECIFNENFVCAFKNKKQMFEWICKKELQFVLQEGMVRVYEVHVVKNIKHRITYAEGEHQVVYHKESVYRKKDITHTFISK